MPDKKENNNDIAGDTLVELLKTLMEKNDSKISAESFEKIIPTYDGKNIPIKQWFDNFEKNAEAYGLSDKQKYVHARNKMSGLAQLFLESTTVSDYKTLEKELYDEFHKKVDSAQIHENMRKRKIRENESLREYVLNMKKLAAIGNVEESAIIKYTVDGLGLANEAKYLLYSSKSIKELYDNYNIVEKLNKRPEESKKVNKSENKKAIHCFNCGSTAHKRSECNASTKCFKCNEFGHIAKNCTRSIKNVNTVVEQKRGKTITINGQDVRCLVDTGADVTILNYSIYKTIDRTTLNKSYSVLRGLGNKKTMPIGEFTGEVAVDGMCVYQKFVIVPDDAIGHYALLGYDFISRFHFSCDEEGFKFSALLPVEETADKKQMSIYNIVDLSPNIVVPPQHEKAVLQMIERYNPEQKEKCPVELKIVPDGEIHSFRHAPARLPPEESEAVRKQVSEWLNNGIVRKSASFVASRVVVVKKKCGSLRVCVDFRQLNKMVLKDCFPVPVMDDIFEKLQKAKFFTVMDLESGFFHVPVEENSKKYLAFVTKEGLFEFNVTPFGFCNSPAAFIRFVNHIFQELINEKVMELYMDDIIVYALTAEECIEKVGKVLKRAEVYNLKINWKKCSFLQKRIDFLGHVVEDGKIWPGQEKTNAVNKFKTPTNIKAVQSFLGLTGFFRKFICGYANIARPLTNLLKKGAVFNIGPAETKAIQELKDALTNEPVLRIYSRDALTELHTDAAKEGFGATLLQVFEGKLHPVFFWSKKATEQESQRHSYILEVKAAFLAVKKFRNYLLGVRFKLVTDCAAFKQTTSKKDIPREVAQWILYLQDFNYIVEHRAGSKMGHVDFFSRYPQNVLIASTEVSARMIKAQHKDEHLKAVTEILKNRPYENYKIKGGLIYKNVSGHDVLVVPKTMENEIIKEAHNVGHFAAQKTTHSLQQQYWIPHLEKKVSQIIGNCVQCIIHNKKLGKKEGFLHFINKGDSPLHTLHVDHLGPMDATTKQYKHIFAVVDSFTKFVWLYPTKSTGCDEVLRKLTDWTNIFGNPVRLVSDQGVAFTANAFKSYVETNNIEHVLTTTGVARGNGQIERVNRVILSIIAKLSADDPTKWYKFVSNVQRAINSHVHSSTKVSPFQLLFGVKMNCTFGDRILQTLEEEIVANFDEERNKLRESAKQQIQQAQIVYKRNYDKNRKVELGYEIGDLVAIKRTQFVAGKKLASDYIGPYEVIKVKRNGRYDIKKAAGEEGPHKTSTSCDNMKLWKYIQENEDLLSSGTDEEL